MPNNPFVINRIPEGLRPQINPNENAAVPEQPLIPERMNMEEIRRWWREEFQEEGNMTKKKGKRGEELFQLILSGIREIYDVEAVIAGGAVRDLAAGVSDSKDVDVFVPLTWEKFEAGLNELFWQGPTRLLGA